MRYDGMRWEGAFGPDEMELLKRIFNAADAPRPEVMLYQMGARARTPRADASVPTHVTERDVAWLASVGMTWDEDVAP